MMMLKINVMRTFLNRLRDRGWININARGYTNSDIQVLRRGDEKKIGVEQINVDPTGDIRAQIDGFFKNLIELIMKTDSKDIFLPGGGDIPVPDFFREFCRNYGVNIHIISIDTLKEYINID